MPNKASLTDKTRNSLEGESTLPLTEAAENASASALFHFPDVPGTQKLVQVAGTALGDDFLNLVLHDIFVAGQIIPSPENADRGREAGAVLHVR